MGERYFESGRIIEGEEVLQLRTRCSDWLLAVKLLAHASPPRRADSAPQMGPFHSTGCELCFGQGGVDRAIRFEVAANEVNVINPHGSEVPYPRNLAFEDPAQCT